MIIEWQISLCSEERLKIMREGGVNRREKSLELSSEPIS